MDDMDSKQIVDALTSHIALYSASTASATNRNPNPRAAIIRWLSTLSVPQRQSHLTILDPSFIKILLQMRSKNLTSGPSVFFILPDLPTSSDPSLPALCSRRSRGLLLRSHNSDEGARSVSASLRLFGSKEGKGECEIDTAIVSEELVADLGRFMEVMDGVSNGGFLRGEVEGMDSAWAEAKWLKEKGYYSLESFVVNRIEMALRLSWKEWNGWKKKKGVKVKGNSGVGAGVAANLFWRKKGCIDWFLGLDPGVRKRMCVTFLSKGARTLVKENANDYDDFLKSGTCFFKDIPSLPHKYESLSSSQRIKEFPSRKDTCFSLNAISEIFSASFGCLRTCLKDLFMLQQIVDMLLLCQSSSLEADNMFFSTLNSVGTIPDDILRRFRCFLMMISCDCIEFELTRHTGTDTPVKKPEQKSNLASHSQRRKNKCQKRLNPTQKLQNSPAVEANKIKHQRKEKECLVPAVSSQKSKPPKAIEFNFHHDGPTCEQHSQVLSSDQRIISCSQFEGSAVHNNEEDTAKLPDSTACIRKKGARRKGTRHNKSSLKHTTIKVEKSTPVSNGTLCPSSVTEVVSACADSPASSMPTSIMVQVNLPYRQIFANAVNESETKTVKEVNNDSAVDYSSSVYVDNRHISDEHYQILDQSVVNITSSNLYIHRNSKSVTNSSPLTSEVTGDNCRERVSLQMDTSDDTNSVSTGFFGPVGECVIHSGKELVVCDSSISTTDTVLQSAVPAKSLEVIYDGHDVSQTEVSGCDPCIGSTGATSFEWPILVPLQSQVSSSNDLPVDTNRLHLDAGYKPNQPNHLHQSVFPIRHQARNTTDSGGGHNIPSLTSLSLDSSLTVRSFRGLNQPGISNYDSIYNSKLQSTSCMGITTNGVQFKGAYDDSDRRLSGGGVDLPGFQNALDMMDDSESHWLSDEEIDLRTINGRDYNKYFGGGVMFWNTSDHAGTGFSRPPSHSSEDGSWAWYDADLNRAIDDMVGLPAPYNVNGLASPSTASFCSPFETLGPGKQSIGYMISGNDASTSALDSQAAMDLSEESVSGTLNTSTCSGSEGIKGDSFPYPILRPIIPRLSRKSSRSEFMVNGDNRSPCLPSARRDPSQLKRPPSPVVLCVPRARVPPHSPVGVSRKHKGFPIVRSGSSSPRHWGVQNWYHEEFGHEDMHRCMDSPEVVWASWDDKTPSGSALMQGIPGSLLHDRLIAISQLSRDQEHPDVAFPVQPPELENCPSWETSLTMMQNLLHEEISSFCKKVAVESHAKKPFINWAVKRVARSLQVLWPRSRTNIFGSNATGLALPNSDVDLVVCLPPVRNLEPIKEAGILEGRNGIKETCLQHAARYLANQEWVKTDSLKIIENTAIPLIMLVVEVPIDFTGSSTNISISQRSDTLSSVVPMEHCSLLHSRPSNVRKAFNTGEDTVSHVKPIHLDISFNSPSHMGLQTTELVRELTKQFPASIPLALVLKQFLADRSLDHSYSGGLSSYCLVLLITRFLQHEHHLGRLLNQNLGALLMDFLYFFGNVFDPRQMRISIQGSGLYMTRERGHSIDPVHIDDPFCPTNNVGRNCFRIHQCIKAFADAYSALESVIGQFPGNSDSSIPTVKLLRKIIPSINRQEHN